MQETKETIKRLVEIRKEYARLAEKDWVTSGALSALENAFNDEALKLESLPIRKNPECSSPVVFVLSEDDDSWIPVNRVEFPANKDLITVTIPDEDAGHCTLVKKWPEWVHSSVEDKPLLSIE